MRCKHGHAQKTGVFNLKSEVAFVIHYNKNYDQVGLKQTVTPPILWAFQFKTGSVVICNIEEALLYH